MLWHWPRPVWEAPINIYNAIKNVDPKMARTFVTGGSIFSHESDSCVF